jgi:hypothetical protein
MEDMRNAYKILVGKPEENRLVGRSRSRWGDNIRIDLRETGVGRCEMDSSGLG